MEYMISNIPTIFQNNEKIVKQKKFSEVIQTTYFFLNKNQTYSFQGVVFCNFKILKIMRNFNILCIKPEIYIIKILH